MTLNGFQDRRIRPLCHFSFLICKCKNIKFYSFKVFYKKKNIHKIEWVPCKNKKDKNNLHAILIRVADEYDEIKNHFNDEEDKKPIKNIRIIISYIHNGNKSAISHLYTIKDIKKEGEFQQGDNCDVVY